MITENSKKGNAENAGDCEFGNAIRELKISSLLKASNIHKKRAAVSLIFFSSYCFSCSQTAISSIS